jgi:hypothetical protein
MARQVEELVRPADIDRLAWDPLLDVDLSPDWNLPYLGQFVGVRVTPGATPAQARQQIKAEGGFQRGTPGAMIAAVKPTLGGNAVRVPQGTRRRRGPHHRRHAHSGDAERPAVTLAAAVSQKAAGLILVARRDDGADLPRERCGSRHVLRRGSATYGTYAAARGF